MTPEELRASIVPKSDQLNADSLLAGPITVQIESVKAGDSKEQPVSIGIGKDHQPYKPCKSMRRVLIAAWGDQGKDWVGKSMTLFCDPSVAWGGVKVGGIRISHLSHIDSDRTLMLTTSRGKKSEFHVKKLGPKQDPLAELQARIMGAESPEALLAIWQEPRADSLREAVRPLVSERGAALKAGKPTDTKKLLAEATQGMSEDEAMALVSVVNKWRDTINKASLVDVPELEAEIAEQPASIREIVMPQLRLRVVLLKTEAAA